MARRNPDNARAECNDNQHKENHFHNFFRFSCRRLCAAEKLKLIHGHKNSVEKNKKTEARRLKAHYGRLRE
jgi:hypothetical protein